MMMQPIRTQPSLPMDLGAFAALELDDHADADDDDAQDAEDQADAGGPVQDRQQATWPVPGRSGWGSG